MRVADIRAREWHSEQSPQDEQGLFETGCSVRLAKSRGAGTVTLAMTAGVACTCSLQSRCGEVLCAPNWALRATGIA
jgi:hypothetical protein